MVIRKQFALQKSLNECALRDIQQRCLVLQPGLGIEVECFEAVNDIIILYSYEKALKQTSGALAQEALAEERKR